MIPFEPEIKNISQKVESMGVLGDVLQEGKQPFPFELFLLRLMEGQVHIGNKINVFHDYKKQKSNTFSKKIQAPP